MSWIASPAAARSGAERRREVAVLENFAEFDVPWRTELVRGGAVCRGGEFMLPEGPGLGVELDVEACARRPYKKNTLELFH
jgi:L-alanine-DL-glutamate epimerase-like enolase superfamily enzyme